MKFLVLLFFVLISCVLLFGSQKDTIYLVKTNHNKVLVIERKGFLVYFCADSVSIENLKTNIGLSKSIDSMLQGDTLSINKKYWISLKDGISEQFYNESVMILYKSSNKFISQIYTETNRPSSIRGKWKIYIRRRYRNILIYKTKWHAPEPSF